MTLVLILAALAVIGITGASIIESKTDSDVYFLFAFIGVISACFMIAILIVGTINTITAPADNQAMLETQKALEFKLSSAAVRDEFGLLNKSFVDEVETYNKKLARHRINAENHFISFLYPKKTIEGCERIDYERFKTRGGVE